MDINGVGGRTPLYYTPRILVFRGCLFLSDVVYR